MADATTATEDLAPQATQAANGASKRALRLREVLQALRFAAFAVTQSSIPTMAANLAFRALFGLLPVLVVATMVARAVMGEGFDDLVEKVIAAFGIDALRVGLPDAASETPLSTSVGPWIRQLIVDAAKIDLAGIGLVGTLVVLFSAIWTMTAIEGAFNAVTRAPAGRPLLRRVLIYWFVLTAGPILFAAIPFSLRVLTDASGGEDAMLGRTLGATIANTGSFAALWLLIGFAFVAVPNIRVDPRCAAIGACVSALLISLGKGALAASLAGSFEINQLYGSLGFLPLFMMWVYLMWLVVLYGLQLAVILQSFSRGGRAFAASGDGPDFFEPASAVDAFTLICARFATGKSTRMEDLQIHCGLAPRAAKELLLIMEKRKLLLRAGASASANNFVPAALPSHFTHASALECGFALADGGEICTAKDKVQRLRDAQLTSLQDERF